MKPQVVVAGAGLTGAALYFFAGADIASRSILLERQADFALSGAIGLRLSAFGKKIPDR